MSYATPVPNLNTVFVFMISMKISEKRPHSPEKIHACATFQGFKMQKLYINEYLQRQPQTLFHILHEDSLVHLRKEPYITKTYL